jgi:2-keto-4-pentenoate hydratase/2-oxohepta-3-ene-1,7-dioic acid hydratase in catechol pathway
MRIYRFKHGGRVLYGVLKEDILYPVKGSIYRDFSVEDAGIPVGEVELLPPAEPTKIVAIGSNYKDHAKEMGKPLPEEPMIFIKPSSAVIGPNGVIRYPETSRRVDYEGELALVIKKETHLLGDDADTADHILGYTCFNDITARDLQIKDGQFTRAKSFDTFAAFGPCVVTDLNPSRLEIKTFLNGKLKQSSNTGHLIFPIPFLVRFISRVMTLYPGDMITTGTPAGIGSMEPGDRVDVQIEGIGVLSNTVKKARE